MDPALFKTYFGHLKPSEFGEEEDVSTTARIVVEAINDDGTEITTGTPPTIEITGLELSTRCVKLLTTMDNKLALNWSRQAENFTPILPLRIVMSKRMVAKLPFHLKEQQTLLSRYDDGSRIV